MLGDGESAEFPCSALIVGPANAYSSVDWPFVEADVKFNVNCTSSNLVATTWVSLHPQGKTPELSIHTVS